MIDVWNIMIAALVQGLLTGMTGYNLGLCDRVFQYKDNAVALIFHTSNIFSLEKVALLRPYVTNMDLCDYNSG